jgi:hypothetical protein
LLTIVKMERVASTFCGSDQLNKKTTGKVTPCSMYAVLIMKKDSPTSEIETV